MYVVRWITRQHAQDQTLLYWSKPRRSKFAVCQFSTFIKCAPNFSLGKGKSANGFLLDYWCLLDYPISITLFYLAYSRLPYSFWQFQREYLAWAKPEFIYTLLCYHRFTWSVPIIFHKCKLISAKNIPRKWYYISLLRLKGIFSGLRCLSNSQIIPL